MDFLGFIPFFSTGIVNYDLAALLTLKEERQQRSSFLTDGKLSDNDSHQSICHPGDSSITSHITQMFSITGSIKSLSF